jgi:hypothetical protein
VLAIIEKTFGPEHPEVARSLRNASFIYKCLGRHKEAELIFKKAVVIQEKVLGEDNL